MKQRILLKLSGETLSGTLGYGIDFSVLNSLAKQVVEVRKKGYEVAVVMGAGNIWRFRDNRDSGIERVASDNMGMIATVMNSVALMSAIEHLGVPARVASAIDIPEVAEKFITRKVMRHMEKGRVVICAGGTGNPYFTTDTAATLRALELRCSMMLKATNVKGVYSADPKKNPKAQFLPKVTYDQVLEKNLQVMDGSAIALARDGKLPVIVFEFSTKSNNILKVLQGKFPHTLVKS